MIISEKLDGYTVVGIGEKAFYSCESLEKVEMPDTIIEISNYVFAYCHNLKTVKLSKKLEVLGDQAFGGCGLTDIEIPKSLVSAVSSFFIAMICIQ